MTVRRHDVTLPSISATVFTTPKPHELTIVELRVAYTRYPTGSTGCYSPAAVIKWNLFPETADTKAPFPSELGIIIVLVLLPASPGYFATRAPLPANSFLPEQTVLRLHFRRRGEDQSVPNEEFKPTCHL
jgi:non-ribosomal peptide synthetase component F